MKNLAAPGVAGAAPPSLASPANRRWPLLLVASLLVLTGSIFTSCTPFPWITIQAPPEVLIGEDFHLQITFQSAFATGYGPYVDLFLPTFGFDGPAAGPCDGITFVQVSPAAPVATPVTFAAPTCVPATAGRVHPLTGVPVDSAFDAYQLVVLELTFSNFEPSPLEPPVVLDVTVHLSDFADVRGKLDPDDCDAAGLDLEILARGGFRWGADPLDNPGVDPPAPIPPLNSYLAKATVSPRVFSLGHEDPLSASPGSCFDGTDNGGDGLVDFADPDCGRKTYLGPEDETATGPTFPQRYQLSVDVASGQTITDLEIVDVLPAGMQFVGIQSTQVRRPALTLATLGPACGQPGVDYVASTPSGSSPGGTLSITICSVTGTPQPDDVVVVFEFFIPQFDALGQPILNPETCEPTPLTNDVWARGRWIPLDPRDRPADPGELCVKSDRTGADHVLFAKCAAIQKSVALADDGGASGATPGDRLRYTLAVQVSDYFPMGGLQVVDVLSDGQSFVQPPAPHLEQDGDFTVPATLDVATNAPGCGETTLTFDLSKQLVAGNLDPDGVVAGWSGAITFDAVIDSNFECPPPAGDTSVDKHDPLPNRVRLRGKVYNDLDGQPTGVIAQDGSSAETVIVSRALEKTIYGVWRHPASQPEIPPANLDIAAGDGVVYRLRYPLPSCDAEAMDIRDYLPKPVLDVGRPNLASSAWPWDDSGVFDCSDPANFPAPLSGFPAPLSGTVQYGPDHTGPQLANSSNCTGLVSSDESTNTLHFVPGTVHGPDDAPCVIDLLYTLEATCDPFADGLFLSNRAIECEGNSFSHSPRVCQEASARFRYVAPKLKLSKGVVSACCALEGFEQEEPDPVNINLRRGPAIRLCGGATGVLAPSPPAPVSFTEPGSACPRFSQPITSAALASSPIASNLQSGIDPGGFVTFALVVENLGHDPDGAFDVAIEDLLPLGQGFDLAGGQDGIHLCITDGTGTPLPYTGGRNGNQLDLKLDDPGAASAPPGSLASIDAAPGTNLAVITYDLKLSSDVAVGSCLENQAAITHYRSQACDQNLAEAGFGGPRTAAATICRNPEPAKRVAATSESHTPHGELAIGEIVRYRLEVVLPEGTTNFLKLVDTLPPGLQLLDPTPSPRVAPPGLALAVMADAAPTLPAWLANGFAGPAALPAPLTSPPAVTLPVPVPTNLFTVTGDPLGGGQTVTLDLGAIGNNDRDCNDEILVVELNALVLNAVGNDAGVRRTNRFHIAIGKKHATKTLHAPPISHTLVEPRLSLSKTLASAPPSPGLGSQLTYTLTFTNTGTATAFEARLHDRLPSCLKVVPGSVQLSESGGATGAVPLMTGKIVGVTGATVPVGGTVTVTFSAEITCKKPTCDTTTNDAFVIWTSLPATGTLPNPTGSRPPGSSGAPDGERTGAGGVNDYRSTASAQVPFLCTVCPGEGDPCVHYLMKPYVSYCSRYAGNCGPDEIYFENECGCGCRCVEPSPPDLTIEKSMTDAFLVAGKPQARYSLTITNLGPGATQGAITVTDKLPPGFRFVSGGGGGWNCTEPAPGQITCTHPGTPPLAPFASDTVVVEVKLDPSSSIGDWFGSDLVNCAGVRTLGEVRLDNNEDCLTQPCPNPDDIDAGLLPAFLATCKATGICDPALCRDIDPAICGGLPFPAEWFWSPCGCGCREVFFPRALPPGSTEDPTPLLTGGSDLVVPGSIACACGNFPDEETRASLLLDGAALGTPVTASQSSLQVKLPADLALGGHRVIGRPEAGFGASEAWSFEAIEVQASLDQSELRRGGSTEMRLTVVGTEKPVSIRMINRSPEGIALEGGDEQTLSTSGGPDNSVSRTVRGLRPGGFDLRWELDLPACPCAEEDQAEPEIP